MDSERVRKIVLIGADGYDYTSSDVRVMSFAWDSLNKVLNLSDHDVVIVDLLSLDDPDSLDAVELDRVLNTGSTQQVLREQGTAIFVLGDPRFSITRKTEKGYLTEPFLTWTGADFTWDKRSGDTLESSWRASEAPYETYINSLSKWTYSLAAVSVKDWEFSKAWDIKYMRASGRDPYIYKEAICSTRYGHDVVFFIQHSTVQEVLQYGIRSPDERTTQVLSQPIYFLPATNLSRDETLELVLRDFCGVDVSAPEPIWVSDFVVPGEEQLNNDLANLQERIEELEIQKQEKSIKLSEYRAPIKLLYETGPALEETVFNTLELLGAEVERPTTRSYEDGWITVEFDDEVHEGVLEIKGVKPRHFSIDAVRQLASWISRGKFNRKKTYTGIFVGNSDRETQPKGRVWPFSANWIEQATLHECAAILTEDLYVLYVLAETDRLDKAEFWRELFNTIGPFNIAKFRSLLTDDEREQLSSLSASD